MTRPRFTLSRRRRHRIEALVAHLVGLLDAADGDPDLEDSHDAEADQADHEADDCDDEPSAQALVTPGSRRPIAPPVWMRGAL